MAKGMHVGSANSADSKTARLYRLLLAQEGHWIAADTLQAAIGAKTAISTYISGVRHLKDLPANVDVEHESRPNQEGGDRLHFYRLVHLDPRPWENGTDEDLAGDSVHQEALRREAEAQAAKPIDGEVPCSG